MSGPTSEIPDSHRPGRHDPQESSDWTGGRERPYSPTPERGAAPPECPGESERAPAEAAGATYSRIQAADGAVEPSGP
jgi:hypothetical protein